METFLHFFVGLVLVAIIITYSYKRIIKNNSSNKKGLLPEPSGALPIIGHLHLLVGKDHASKILAKISDKYGPVFSLRFGSQPAVIVSNWKMAKEFFGTYEGHFVDRPDMSVGRYLFYDNAGFGVANGPYWREMRKMVNVVLFTKMSLEKHQHIRYSEVNYFISELYKLSSKNSSIDLKKWFEHLVLNINIRTMFGQRFERTGFIGENDGTYAVQAFKSALKVMGSFVVSDYIPYLKWLDIGGSLKTMKKVSKQIDDVIGKWVEEHLDDKKNPTDEKESDVMHALLSIISKQDGMYGFGRENIIKATTFILMMAGTDSTFDTMTWAISALLNHPHTLKAAQKELDENVGKEKWVEESDIKNLSYLQAVVKETMRIYPAGPLGATRQAVDDVNVAGYHISKGTHLLINIWKLHRDPTVWSDPEEFRPERFLGERANLNYLGQNFEYTPFGSGRRMCPGHTYAVFNIHITLARLLQGFDLSTPMGKPVDMTEGPGVSLPKATPLEVIATPRLSTHLYQNLTYE